MENKFQNIIDNRIALSNLDKYAAIIGSHPSKGARSPLLWNSAFKEHKLNYSMVPLDVLKEKLPKLLDKLNLDKSFIGGAITTPHKTDVAKWLGKNVTDEAYKIGAVNCLFRGKDGNLSGTNTDGEGSVKALTEQIGEFKNKNILILGFGGAGKAVSVYFSYSTEKGDIYVSTRKQNDTIYINKLKNSIWIDWSKKEKLLNKIDIVINCTSIGFGDQEQLSPLGIEDLQKIKKNGFIYDIIYQPERSVLLKNAHKIGLKTLNGSKMNFIQAVLAFNYALPHIKNKSLTFEAMKKILN